ncbi:MAG: 16S rRNA (cytosine(1402)-N(4))-methyltransferase RsmH [Candidatus Peregrinibacteria bacterium]
MSHIPVLPEEVLSLLRPAECSVLVDATLGMGGHTELFFQKNPSLTILAFDQDPFARKKAEERLFPWKEQLKVFPENFENLPQRLLEKGVFADGMLFDVGMSSLHLDDESRGFSFRHDGPLDMRMDPSQTLTAETVVNRSSEEELSRIFWELGEERFARRIAKAIVDRRKKTPFIGTVDLAECIANAKPKFQEYGGGHPAAQAFQALRIAVNRELEVLKTALVGALEYLAPHGRIAVISFHSLEDRIVKEIFQSQAVHQKRQKYPSHSEEEVSPTLEKKFEILTKKPVVPSPLEIHHNPRARSARMRVIERLF